jgi:hypothetical protein
VANSTTFAHQSIGSINMPIKPKYQKVLHAMQKQYGKKKGTQIFYASVNKYSWDYSLKGTHKSKGKKWKY